MYGLSEKIIFYIYKFVKMEINLKSDNLLDDYKKRENEILTLQLRIANEKAKLEETDLYKNIKEDEEMMYLLKKQNEEYKEIVKEKMLDSWLKSLETFSHKITVKWTVGKLVIEKEDLVPQEYIKEVKPVFDNAKIKSDIKDWKDIAWCNLIEWRSLVITEK